MKIPDTFPHIIMSNKNAQGNVIKEKIPVEVSSKCYPSENGENFTKYLVKTKKIPIGYVNLIDKKNGVQVSFIRNYNPQIYSGFGKIADQIEVEHCIKRGLTDFEITSEAALNSHAYHYLRGKRFGMITDIAKRNELLEKFKTLDVNKIVKRIIAMTPVGEEYNTKAIGAVPMFMPKELIKKYIELAKEHPLLKK